MRRAIYATGVLLIFLSDLSWSQRTGMGAGIVVGDIVGADLKYWFSSVDAVEGSIGWSLVENGIGVNASYLMHFFDILDAGAAALPLVAGGGGIFTGGDDPAFAVRGVAGMTYLFDDRPGDLFIQAAPGFRILPELDFDVGASLGFRFYF